MDIDKSKQNEIEELYNKIRERKKNYWIIDFKPQEHQEKTIWAVSEVYQDWKDILNKYRFLLFQWGNWAWKTVTALYIVVLLALWELCRDYWLPYIWSKREIYIGTKSWDNLKNSIMPYLLWDYSVIRIPPELIEKVVQDNWAIKSIKLKNGCIIKFFTYDQGRERIQGTNGDFYLLDEEPKDADIFYEALARIRWKKSQMLMSFTPLSWYTPAYEYFYEQESDKIKDKSYIQRVNSLENKYADHTWAEWLTENEKKMRMEGMFIPPSWLVYPNFTREKNTIEYFNPSELWNVKYYAGLDFGQVHPTAFVPVAVDEDENLYIFDLIYKSNILNKELADWIKAIENKYKIEFEYIIADPAGKWEMNELKTYWIKTVWADKWSKWENGQSNRSTSIMKVNQLLHDWKIYIADHLKDIIKEFESHHYKPNGTVEKTQDDALDALRYFIFSYKPPKYITKREIEYQKKYKSKYNKRSLSKGNNKPY